ncbi:MAG TPA: formylglycine-generating enzyme family protein [Xanthobacteraceae bacterium]|jgi:formylglycine-generating enzyme required for sulfatase activity|nr:formylglycine-generating enzyme family protein [Xanthobacteraceae bacterium]
MKRAAGTIADIIVGVAIGSLVLQAGATAGSAEPRLEARLARIKTETAALVAAGLAQLSHLSAKDRLAAPAAIWQVAGPRVEFKDCAKCPQMVVVPAGEFTMGSPPSDMEAEAQHRVTIAYPFAVSKFSITFDEWNACLQDGGCDAYRPDDQGWGRGRRPVIDVSWDNAKSYVAWLSRKTGKPYRLLSEAEWEFAARAGTTTRYSVGDSITPAQANYNGAEEGSGPSAVNRQKTLPVGSFKPNGFGLYDMQGNVWAWVEDCWHDDYTAGVPTDGSAWLEGECDGRVMRGGSWQDSDSELRSAARIGEFKSQSSYTDGIRVARGL